MQEVKVLLLKEAIKFLSEQSAEAKRKIFKDIERVESGNANTQVFKKLKGTEIWEVRTLYNGIAYRLFAFWDKKQGALVVATHGLIKKDQKTPLRDIEKAERIRNEYMNR